MTAIIHTPTPSLQGSLSFYRRLKYRILSESNPTYLTDGKVIIEINPDIYARAGVKIFRKSWTEEIQQLSRLTTIHQNDQGYLLNDFNGCYIYLIESSINHKLHPTNTSTSLLGNFVGMSLESTDLSKSLDIWTTLGFAVTMDNREKGIIIVKNEEGFSITMMRPFLCPHLFFNPSMTYFNGDENLHVIANVRKANIPITQEITHFNKEGIVDNIIIRDPGGYGFFVFND